MSDFIGIVVGVLLSGLYLFGMYEIIADDHRYTTKDVVIGVAVPPYPLWVGGKEAYRVLSSSSEDRKTDEKCLDAFEAIGLPRKPRLRLCECIVKTHDPDECKSKIFGK